MDKWCEQKYVGKGDIKLMLAGKPPKYRLAPQMYCAVPSAMISATTLPKKQETVPSNEPAVNHNAFIAAPSKYAEAERLPRIPYRDLENAHAMFSGVADTTNHELETGSRNDFLKKLFGWDDVTR
ncbi:hypothetical protein CLAFUW4_08140 [Fulvia fulva]|uniref:Uncharacterized protein n=1 Tax=Passalora fulva TaxID=5499 RepID=A0A9Q8LCP5_PASFU|nr:uncharacterized protein CLAFUR5_08254 [Fulvia fulva]KAK4628909.1 hypothetical protein CLAFUR4_08145 [Fulvia fulva]KAK4630810.1 hypothetical protein CLAFUR0_08140 [Fulvia fulva]UJO15022.1 hypothetical protein CLAFUR5_08254 [Fulvia fulva]WPV12109.1 hypothetical protein CLAFUW4_08140 [Fulvia fulva]WPV27957.1 hypothetical protein CLAFUW7_08140 [Fulvia fulva]